MLLARPLVLPTIDIEWKSGMGHLRGEVEVDLRMGDALIGGTLNSHCISSNATHTAELLRAPKFVCLGGNFAFCDGFVDHYTTTTTILLFLLLLLRLRLH